MIDVNKNTLRILPAEHIAFKNFDYAVSVDKKNKLLEKAIYSLITTGILVLIFYIIKDAESRNKK